LTTPVAGNGWSEVLRRRRRLTRIGLPCVVAIVFLVAGGGRAGYLSATLPDHPDAEQVELYGNFETLGVIADVPAGMKPEDVSGMRCAVWLDGRWAPAQELVQVGANPWFATSLFWLAPDSEYLVRVEVLDRAGRVAATWHKKGRTRAEVSVPATSHTIHVAVDGNDAGPGTPEQPLATIGHALTRAAPDTTIEIHGGTYHEGEIRLPVGGTAEGAVVIRASQGAKVVISGADPGLADPAGWRAEEQGLYSHPLQGPCGYVSATVRASGEDIRLLPVKSLDDLKKRVYAGQGPFREVGIRGAYFCDGRTIHIVPPAKMAGLELHVARHTRGLSMENCNHVYLEGLEFRHYGRERYNCAVFAYACSDLLFQKCAVHFCNTGFWFKDQCDRVTVQDCRFTDATQGWKFDMLKQGGGYHNEVESGGVNADGSFSGRGLVVRRNHIEGLFDGVHLCPWSKDTARTNEIDFYDNRVFDVADDFIETDGFSRNVRIFDNYMRKSLSGISVAQALDGPTFILYNVIADCGMARAGIVDGYEGYPFKTNGGSGADVGSGPIFFYHNTSFTRDERSSAILIKKAKWRKITFRNNIWCGGKAGFESWRADFSPIDFDYDNLHVASDPGALFKLQYRQLIPTLEEVRRQFGCLKNGISADPCFENAAQGEFRLRAGSPCVDAGVALPGINERRIHGKAPDMGAFEYAGDTPRGAGAREEGNR
jgi:hypothetical protein